MSVLRLLTSARHRLGRPLIGLLLAVPAAGSHPSWTPPAAAQTVAAAQPAQNDADSMILHAGKVQVVRLPRPAADVIVSEPNIVNTVMRTATQAVLYGMGIGQANVLFFDAAGEQIRAIEIRVEHDTRMLDRLITEHFPGAQVRAESILGEVVLTGVARTSAEAAAIGGLAERFVAASRAAQSGGEGEGGGEGGESDEAGIINRITVLNEEQIHLRVQVAEVNRGVLKRLGIDWNAGLQSSTLESTIGFSGDSLRGFLSAYEIEYLTDASGTPIDVSPQDGVQDFLFQENRPIRISGALDSFLKALEQYTLVRTLAEPSLTAVSGESASFLAGGEFPVPVGVDGDAGTTIEFKQFGVALDFTPVVIGDGRISLKVSTEVSELSTNGAINIDGLTIPALRVRRANTTVELSSGGTIMIGGLIQQSTRRLSVGLPGLRQLPVLGALFRSEEFVNDETELVVLVTPYTVVQGQRSDFTLPTDGFAPPSDADMYLFGRLWDVYGAGDDDAVAARAAVEAQRSPVGFIME